MGEEVKVREPQGSMGDEEVEGSLGSDDEKFMMR